jgi:tRNA nucleotidyltransferase (CCA-adding enzyme)
MNEEMGMIIFGQPPGNEIIRLMQKSDLPGEILHNNIFKGIIPELWANKWVIQGDMKIDIYQHTADVLNSLDNRRPVCLLAALFHDVGKKNTIRYGYRNTVSFHGHEIVSSNIARQYMQDWGLDVWTIDRVCRIIETHMADIKSINTSRAVRNFIARVGQDNFDNWISVRLADAEAYGSLDVKKMILKFEDRIIKSLKMPEVTEEDLVITRKDLVKLLNIKEPMLDFIINNLLAAVNSCTYANDRIILLSIAANMAE